MGFGFFIFFIFSLSFYYYREYKKIKNEFHNSISKIYIFGGFFVVFSLIFLFFIFLFYFSPKQFAFHLSKRVFFSFSFLDLFFFSLGILLIIRKQYLVRKALRERKKSDTVFERFSKKE